MAKITLINEAVFRRFKRRPYFILRFRKRADVTTCSDKDKKFISVEAPIDVSIHQGAQPQKLNHKNQKDRSLKRARLLGRSKD